MKNLLWITCFFLIACGDQKVEDQSVGSDPTGPKGNLFIIGGGDRPESLIKDLVDVSGLNDGYGIVLPMSSAEPDTSAYYAIKQFEGLSNASVVPMYLTYTSEIRPSQLDSLEKASLIYITGGDQNRFMDTVRDTGVIDAIRKAYMNGATIAGTSAGAAMMSKMMITGDEKRHPDYNSTFQHIENDNIVLREGLGLIEDAIIDQHFIKRSRYNRLISAVIEHPELKGIGIDESTAAVIHGDTLRVAGESQVIIFSNPDTSRKDLGSLLGAKGIVMDVLLPGEMIILNREN